MKKAIEKTVSDIPGSRLKTHLTNILETLTGCSIYEEFTKHDVP